MKLNSTQQQEVVIPRITLWLCLLLFLSCFSSKHLFAVENDGDKVDEENHFGALATHQTGQLDPDFFAFRPGYTTNYPHTSFVTNESIVFAGSYDNNIGCAGDGYVIFAPFDELPIVVYSDFSYFHDLLEIDDYPTSYAEHFLIEEICQDQVGNVVVVVRGFFEDALLAFDYALILSYSPLGELLDNYTLVSEPYELIEDTEIVCDIIPNSVTSLANGPTAETFQNGDLVIESSLVSFGAASGFYVERFEQSNPSTENRDLAITQLEVETFVYYQSETAVSLCNSLMTGISLEVSNMGDSDICSFELSLDRGEIQTPWCTRFERRTIQINDCIAPGESSVIELEDWPTTNSASCHETICAYIFSPNDARDLNNANDESCLEAIFDLENCAGLPCTNEIGFEGTLDQDCLCDLNYSCTNELIVESTVLCGAGGNSYGVTWEITGGAPETDNNASYTIAGRQGISIELSPGETHTEFFGITDQAIFLHATDKNGCYAYWELTEPVDCPVGIQDLNESSDISVFPNPVKDVLSIHLNAATQVFLYDATARLIKTLSLPSGNHNIDLQEYADGIYFLVLSLKGVRYQKRILIQN